MRQKGGKVKGTNFLQGSISDGCPITYWPPFNSPVVSQVIIYLLHTHRLPCEAKCGGDFRDVMMYPSTHSPLISSPSSFDAGDEHGDEARAKIVIFCHVERFSLRLGLVVATEWFSRTRRSLVE